MTLQVSWTFLSARRPSHNVGDGGPHPMNHQMSEVRRFIPVVVGIHMLRTKLTKPFEKDSSCGVEVEEVPSSRYYGSWHNCTGVVVHAHAHKGQVGYFRFTLPIGDPGLVTRSHLASARQNFQTLGLLTKHMQRPPRHDGSSPATCDSWVTLLAHHVSLARPTSFLTPLPLSSPPPLGHVKRRARHDELAPSTP